MQTRYRIHNNKTYLEPVFICQEAWHDKVLSIARQLVLIMGLDNYDRWCTENKEFPDGPVDWQKLHGILEDKLKEEQERLAIIQQGQARQDWIDMKAEDPHT